MYCVHCGKEIPQDSTFCIYCGKAVPNASGAAQNPAAETKQEIPLQDVPAAQTEPAAPPSAATMASPTEPAAPPSAATMAHPTAPSAPYVQPVTYYKDTRKISVPALLGFLFSLISFVAGVILLTMALSGGVFGLLEIYYILPAFAGLAVSLFGLLRITPAERGKALAIVGIVLSGVILAYFYLAMFVSVGLAL